MRAAKNRKSVKNWAAIAGKVVELKIAFAIFLTLCYETPLASELTHLGLSKERLKLRDYASSLRFKLLAADNRNY